MPCRMEIRIISARKLVIRRGTAGSLKNRRRKTLTRNLGETLILLLPDHQFCVIIVGKRVIFHRSAEENVGIREGEGMADMEEDRCRYGEIFDSGTGSSEETGTRGGFSLGSCDDRRLSTPMIAENIDLNVNNNHLINIFVNPNVLDSCELVPEVKVENVRMEVLDNIDKVREESNGFNHKVRGSLRPNEHKDLELREWEKNILVHLNNVNLVERDDLKTLYVNFKLLKRTYTG